MRQPIVLACPFLCTLLVASLSQAATYYVSPDGTATADCTTRDNPCELTAGVALAQAGDTVIVMDGVYTTQLSVPNSGTAEAWITFQADECATPIFEGVGDDGDNQPTGIGSQTETYLRFIGLVSRGWNAGFGNGWAEEGETSNGHFEYHYCIADANGRTGFTFYRAKGIHIRNCMSAHNGSSTLHSWSSGMTLLESDSSSGGGDQALIEGSVSFENADFERHTDGSGFIVDEGAHGAILVNNVAFRNGGSCFRLTKSSRTTFINNTCYHNAQDSQSTGPTNPSEIYFTNPSSQGTHDGISFLNNVLVATGVGPGAEPVANQPTSGWSNNVTATGQVNYFTAPDGSNPDFTPAAAATDLIGRGATGNNVPTDDVGFDPQCIIKATPTAYGAYTNASWWEYSINYEYIQRIGGPAKCFTPRPRTGTPDIGAYLNAAAPTNAPECVPSFGGTPSTGGSAGTAGFEDNQGGTSAGGISEGGTSQGGGPGTGGASGSAGTLTTGGAPDAGGVPGLGGSDPGIGGIADMGGSFASGGTGPLDVGGGPSAGGMPGVGGITGSGGAVAAGGQPALGGSGPSAGGASTGAGGNPLTATGGQTTPGGSTAVAGAATAGTAGDPAVVSKASPDDGGCSCRVHDSTPSRVSWATMGLLGLALLGLRRRRVSRSL